MISIPKDMQLLSVNAERDSVVYYGVNLPLAI